MKFLFCLALILFTVSAKAICYPVVDQTFSPDLNVGFTIAKKGTGWPDADAFGWEIKSSKKLLTYVGDNSETSISALDKIKVSADGAHMTGTTYRDKFAVWELATARRIGLWKAGPDDRIGEFAVAGNFAVVEAIDSYSGARVIDLLNFSSNKIIYEATGKQTFTLSDDGSTFFIADGKILDSIDTASGKKTSAQLADEAIVKITDKNHRLYVVGNMTVRILNSNTLQLISTIHSPLPYSKIAMDVEVSEAKGILKSPTGAIISLNSGKPVFADNREIVNAKLSSDGQLYATSGADGIVRIFNTSTWKMISETCGDL